MYTLCCFKNPVTTFYLSYWRNACITNPNELSILPPHTNPLTNKQSQLAQSPMLVWGGGSDPGTHPRIERSYYEPNRLLVNPWDRLANLFINFAGRGFATRICESNGPSVVVRGGAAMVRGMFGSEGSQCPTGCVVRAPTFSYSFIKSKHIP